jgi:hypothetical protein
MNRQPTIVILLHTPSVEKKRASSSIAALRAAQCNGRRQSCLGADQLLVASLRVRAWCRPAGTRSDAWGSIH